MSYPLKHKAKKRAWSCPSCGHSCQLQFCPNCGEQRPAVERQAPSWAGPQALWNKLNFDGRLWPTLKKLIDAPGELTTAYMDGRRKPYVGPFELFLLINLVFFLVQSVGIKVFSAPLAAELHERIYSLIAGRLLMHWLHSHSMNLGQYTPVYNSLQETLAKALVILMVPLFAMAVVVLSRPRRGVIKHTVFALHFYAFLMVFLGVLLLFLSVLFTGINLLDLKIKLSAYAGDIITGVVFIVGAVYLYLALGRVYVMSYWYRLIGAALLMTAVLYIFYAYRFAMFIATLLLS
ncbi:MAG: DUF3667 domain-containing protein [Gammaproteobacteria bacterium]|nr:DUF3667 domain-containing protein [Gammaproteobacteria bacterium]MDE2344872.1 DUF3667 domain-containing protein [Gammaproteobacteria bacterium]